MRSAGAIGQCDWPVRSAGVIHSSSNAGFVLFDAFMISGKLVELSGRFSVKVLRKGQCSEKESLTQLGIYSFFQLTFLSKSKLCIKKD